MPAAAPLIGDLRPDEPDRVSHAHEAGGDMVRNFDVEPLFARHGDLDEVQPVGAKVFSQPGVVRETRFLGAEVEDEDIPDFCRNVGHHTLHQMLPGGAPRPVQASPATIDLEDCRRPCYALPDHDFVTYVTKGAISRVGPTPGPALPAAGTALSALTTVTLRRAP